LSGYPATHIPRGSGIPQPQPKKPNPPLRHPIIIMCGVGVRLGLVGEVFWSPLLSPNLAASSVAYASPPRRRPSSGESPTAGPLPLIGGSSYLLGMVVALSYLPLSRIFHTVIYKGLEHECVSGVGHYINHPRSFSQRLPRQHNPTL